MKAGRFVRAGCQSWRCDLGPEETHNLNPAETAVDFVIRVEGITKRFPRVLANHDVSLDVRRGEVHALIGENGAGKSTLMNILYGLTRPDSGKVILDGKPLPVSEGFLGIDHGIGMIHQHFMLIGQFTALENIVLGSEPRKGLFLDTDTARSRVESLMREYGMEVDLDRKVDDLSVGEEQRVEILKVLYRDARIIIMDEPTAVLTPQETRGLFSTLKTLTGGGRTVIFISHKLEEVMEVASTVTVLRAGEVIDSMPVAETDAARLAELMVGRSIETVSGRKAASRGEAVLTVENLSLLARKGHELLSHVSFAVHRGEIFGIAGVDGNGQDELFEVLVGLRQPTAGTVEF
ncbi:MAG: ATP-binding cassette domain-containing protein, partial [bacterium]